MTYCGKIVARCESMFAETSTRSSVHPTDFTQWQTQLLQMLVAIDFALPNIASSSETLQ